MSERADPFPGSLARIEALLRDDAALRAPDPDPELEALHQAILLEDALGVTLSDLEIDLAVLSDARRAHEIVARYLGAA